MKNNHVHDALKDLTLEVITLLRNGLPIGEFQVQYSIGQKFRSDGDGQVSWMEYTRDPLVFQLIERIKDKITKLPDYSTCVNAMQKDPKIARHLDAGFTCSEFHIPSNSWQFIARFLEKPITLFIESKTMMSDEFFELAYERFESLFYSDYLLKREVAPLRGFETTIETIIITDQIRIRRLTHDEQAELLQKVARGFGTSARPYWQTIRYVIDYTIPQEKIFGNVDLTTLASNQYLIVKENINKLITALRLLKPGFVSNDFTVAQFDEYLPYGGTTFTGSVADRHYMTTYELTEPEVDEFKLLWSKLATKPDSIVFRRFNYAYTRENTEDKLIDMMIAFEALFLKGDKEKGGASAGNIMSVACSVLIGKNDKERDVIRVNLLEAYKLRNLIVHGSDASQPKKNDSLRKLVSQIEGYLRESIKKMLD